MKKDYFAFISYSHKQRDFAIKLQREFENYNLPTTLNGRERGIPDNYFIPVFRDEEELSAGELSIQITEALDHSINLIVVCSPDAAKSHYVNKEILEFIKLGDNKKINNRLKIFPIIADAKQNSANEKDCFPKALIDLKVYNNLDIVAPDCTKQNYDVAFIKLLAGTLSRFGLKASDLMDRFKRDKEERERLERERYNKVLLMQCCYLSSLAKDKWKSDDKKLTYKLLNYLSQNNELSYDVPEFEEFVRFIDNETELYTDINQFSIDKEILSIKCHRIQDCKPFFCAISPDSSYVAITLYDDNHVEVWDINNNTTIINIDHLETTVCAFFTADSQYLITVGGEHIRIWSIMSGLCYNVFRYLGYLHISSPQSIQKYFSINSKGDYLCYKSPHKSLVLTSLANGENSFLEHQSDVNFMTFSHSGDFLLSYSKDCCLRVWNVHHSQCLYEIKFDYTIDSASFSMSDDKIVIKSNNDIIICNLLSNGQYSITNYISGESSNYFVAPNAKYAIGYICTSDNSTGIKPRSHVLHLDKNRVTITFPQLYKFVSFSSDGDFVATYNSDLRSIHIWDIDNRQCIGIVKTLAPIKQIEFSPDKSFLLILTNKIDIFPLTHQNIYYGKNDKICAFGNTGKYLAQYDSKRCSHKIYTLGQNKIIDIPKCKSTNEDLLTGNIKQGFTRIRPISFSLPKISSEINDGSVVFSYSDTYVAIIANEGDNSVRVYKTESGENVLTISKGNSRYIDRFVNFSRTEDFLVVSDYEKSDIFSLYNGEHLKTVRNVYINKLNPIFDDECKYYLSKKSEVFEVVNVKSGDIHSKIQIKGEVLDVKFSPCSKYIVMYTNQSISVWSIHSGKCKKKIYKHNCDSDTLVFSLDWKYYACMKKNGDVEISLMSSDEVVCLLHHEDCRKIKFSKDSQYVSTISASEIKIWITGKGKCVFTQQIDTSLFGDKQFDSILTEDFKYIVSQESNKIRVVALNTPREIIDKWRRIFGRELELSGSERAMFYL